MPSPAIFATRPQRPREVVHNRDPNRDTLRASVLDVALELGIGTSRAVESLIFDSVLEEDEVEVSIVLARLFPCFLLVYLDIPRCSRAFVLPFERKLSEVVRCMTPCQPVGDNAVLPFVQHPKWACPYEIVYHVCVHLRLGLSTSASHVLITACHWLPIGICFYLRET